jgi:hypothetical protein
VHWALLLTAAAIGVTYVLTQSDHALLYVLSNGLPPLLALIAFTVASAGLIRYGVRTRDRFSTVWLGYSLGVLLWFLGESTWAVYALVYSNPDPFPSIADVFWLVGYVPLIFAIVIQAWPFRGFLFSRRMLAIIAATLVFAGVLLSALIPATFAASNGEDLVSAAIGLAYPLLDVVLLVIALPILFLYGRGTFWRPFLFVAVGLILTFAGDVLFTWTSLNGTYYDGNYLELLFHWSYLSLAYGFYLRFKGGRGTRMMG